MISPFDMFQPMRRSRPTSNLLLQRLAQAQRDHVEAEEERLILSAVDLGQKRMARSIRQAQRHFFQSLGKLGQLLRAHGGETSHKASTVTRAGNYGFDPAMGAKKLGQMTEAQRLLHRAMCAERNADPEQAALLFTQLVEKEPKAETYARLSKQYSDMTFMDKHLKQTDKVMELNKQAIEYASISVDLEPHRAVGHIARCVSRGRLALVMDNKTKVQLAKDAAEDAANALRLEPDNDLAHHLMARWHFEMAGLNAVARTLIKWFFGASLMQGTYTDALKHYRIASDLCPSRAIHTVEIGRTLLKLGDKEGAVKELKKAQEMEIEDINAKLQVQDAKIALASLTNR